MIQQSINGPARIFDLAVYRMQRIARQRRASGTTRRFLWVDPSAGSVQAIEFPTSRQTPIPISALAR